MRRYNQQGYLAIVAVILIVIVGFLGKAVSYFLTNESLTAAQYLSANQAYYVANAGLELAEYNIINKTVSCTGINGSAAYTNASFTGSPGNFTITGSANNISATLSSTISATATSIPVNSASGFTSRGAVLIDSELIAYNGISGNTLLNATRDQTSIAHNTGATVSQSQCLLTAVAGVPNLTAPLGQRTLQESVISGSNANFSPGTYNGNALIPGLVALGSVSLGSNASITNSTVNSTSASFPGSTIVTPTGNTVFNQSADTKIGTALATSSDSNTVKADVLRNYSSINSSNLWNKYFTVSKSAFQASANQSYNANNINGVTGKVIWINSYFNPGGNTTIGSPTSPVILIVNENAALNANTTIYGFVYVMQGLTLSNSSKIVGGAVTENALNMQNGNPTIAYDPTVLSQLGSLSSYVVSSYARVAGSMQEIYP